MKWFAGLFCSASSVLLSINCTGQLTGGGTETTNGISGTVAVFSDGPAGGAVAAVYSVDYRPDSALGVAESTIIGTDGVFKFAPPPASRYNLFIWDTMHQRGAYLPQLPPDTMLGIIQLNETGVIRTMRPDPVAGDSPYSGYLVVIPGSPYYVRAARGTSVTIPLLPQGEYWIDIGLVPKGVSAAGPVWNSQPTIITVDPAVEDTVLMAAP